MSNICLNDKSVQEKYSNTIYINALLLKFWFDKQIKHCTTLNDLGIQKSDFMYNFICTWLSLKGHSHFFFLPSYVYFQNGMSFYLLCTAFYFFKKCLWTWKVYAMLNISNSSENHVAWPHYVVLFNMLRKNIMHVSVSAD